MTTPCFLTLHFDAIIVARTDTIEVVDAEYLDDPDDIRPLVELPRVRRP